jgi:electron transfer flavoprotein alpha subunit
MTTLLLAEHDNKTLKDATNKALTAAKAIGADVHVLVAGLDCKAVAAAAASRKCSSPTPRRTSTPSLSRSPR